jgi:hypothetical protein
LAGELLRDRNCGLKLSELFEPVYNVTDFSKLSIPFKCIGTDLETGNAVVMDHGNIVTAIRCKHGHTFRIYASQVRWKSCWWTGSGK